MNKYGLVRIFSVDPAVRYQTFASKHKLYEKKGGRMGEAQKVNITDRFFKREGTRNLPSGHARNGGSTHVVCCEIHDYQTSLYSGRCISFTLKCLSVSLGYTTV